MLEQQLRQSCNCPEQAYGLTFRLRNRSSSQKPIPTTSSVTSSAHQVLLLPPVYPTAPLAPYSPTQDGNSALSSPLNAPRGITVDTFGNFSLADSGNSIVRKLSSNIIFPSVDSRSATMPITFVVNENINLSAAFGPDFCIRSNTCTGSLIPAAAGQYPTSGSSSASLRFDPDFAAPQSN